MEKTIRHSGNTMPGPDGIPFLAWRRIGKIGVRTLTSVAWALEHPDASLLLQRAYVDEDCPGEHGYNLSTLVCLPKKAAGNDERVGPYYTGDGTRPLSIVNCDNRIVANAVRHRWESHLEKWISQRQQGFLPRRSIITNLLDLEAASMVTALSEVNGATVLLDFASAFPSISQEFMMITLTGIGLPQAAMNLLRQLYSCSQCSIASGGATFPGFALEAGVRQGCPLSPLIYATVAEILMDKIEAECPTTMVRAYADDTALTLRDFWREAPTLARIFQDFEEISGLRLNAGKCVIIPLDGGTTEAFKEKLSARLPAWDGMVVAHTGKYLGFYVGPDKQDRSWKEPLGKFTQRSVMWDGHGLGLQYNALVYNTFSVSVLAYVGQLERLPKQAKGIEEAALRKVAKGPGNWVTPDDLWRLREQYGGVRSFKCTSWVTKAAQLRVLTYDPACQRPGYDECRIQLAKAMSCPERPATKSKWAHWFDNSFFATLEGNCRDLEASIGTRRAMLLEFNGAMKIVVQRATAALHDEHHNAGRHNGNGTIRRSPVDRYKAQFQSMIYRKLLDHKAPSPTERVRHNLDRWKLHDTMRNTLPPGTQVRHNTPAFNSRKSLHYMRVLQGLVTPRVVSSVFSTIWNRWTTHRRMQKRGSVTDRCLLGCLQPAEDSIEHYCRCPISTEFLRKHLNLPPEVFAGLHSFTLCNVNIRSTQQLTTIAIWIYTIYMATNSLRHRPLPDGADIQDALKQWSKEGTRRHAPSANILDNRWNACEAHSTPLPPIPHNI